MAELSDLRLSEMAALATDLRLCGRDAKSVESAAQCIVTLLYDAFWQQDVRETVLVRFYLTHPLGTLPEELAAFARTVVDDVDLPPVTPCLTLLASAGDLPEWNDRRQSRGHQAVPLPSTQVADRFPMIAQLIRQFGLEPGTLVDPDPALIVELDEKTYNVFHVPEAEGSPYIPAADFVREHGVRSALGFGGVLPTGDLFAVVLFARAPVPVETAELFKVLALSVKLAVLPHVDRAVFEDERRPAEHRSEPGRSYALAVEELLEVHERTVQAQAARLEELHAQERRRSQQLHALAEVTVATGRMSSVTEILDHVTEQARRIIHARQAVASLTAGSDWSQAVTSVSLAGEYAPWQDYDEVPDGSGIYALVCETNEPVRLTQEELEQHPRWRGFGASAAVHPPMNGWLAAPLVGIGGVNLGLIQLSDPVHGRFTADDEALLVQLARLAAVSIEGARSYAREHEVAVALQESLLPEVCQVEGLSLASRYLPAAHDLGVGGDWYDVLPLPGGRVLLVVGDVVGHDLGASRTMAQLRHAIRAFAVEDPAPATILTRLDRLTAALSDDDFATVVCLVLTPSTGSVLLANAGHPPPLLLEPGRAAAYLPTADQPPVGMLSPTVYEQSELHLGPAATLLLYSDGLVERRGSDLGAGMECLAAVAGAAPAGPERLLSALQETLVLGQADDDVAMLAVRRPAGAGPRAAASSL